MLHGKAIIYIRSFGRTNYGYYSILMCKGTNLWNSTLGDSTNTKSQYSIYKKKLKKYLLSQQC